MPTRPNGWPKPLTPSSCANVVLTAVRPRRPGPDHGAACSPEQWRRYGAASSIAIACSPPEFLGRHRGSGGVAAPATRWRAWRRASAFKPNIETVQADCRGRWRPWATLPRSWDCLAALPAAAPPPNQIRPDSGLGETSESDGGLAVSPGRGCERVHPAYLRPSLLTCNGSLLATPMEFNELESWPQGRLNRVRCGPWSAAVTNVGENKTSQSAREIERICQ